MYFKNPSSILLLVGQLLLIFMIVISGPVFPVNPASYFFVAAGMVIGIWASVTLWSAGSFNGTAEVSPGSRLVTTGPYKYVRNPIYTGILIFCLGLFFNNFSLLRFFLLLLLFLLLLYKIRLEEYYLSQIYQDYKSYAAKTFRLLPGIW